MKMLVEKSRSEKYIAILEATLLLISERGFHNTPMSLIAKTSGVSIGIIYHYFSGKEELITALYKEIKVEVMQAMLADYAEELSLKERFIDIWRNFVRYSLNHPTKGPFLEQFENSPFAKQVIEEEFADVAAPFFAFYEEGIEEGIFKSFPPLVAFDLGFGTAVSLVKRHRAGLIELDDALVEATAGACWDGIII